MPFSSPSSHAHAKQAAAKAAVSLIDEGMTVGIGTGSTASYFIEYLISRIKRGLSIQAVATSRSSEQSAMQGGIPIVDINAIDGIDLTVDGADEIDEQKRMIKGGGGALLREKIIATLSREMIVIIDASKKVKRLGSCALPVEIVPFAWKQTQRAIEKMGYPSTLRQGVGKDPYLTDNGHYILDLVLKSNTGAPELIDAELKSVAGVVETGLFLRLAGRVFIGYEDGSTTLWQ